MIFHMKYTNKIPYILLTFAVLFWSGNFIVGRAFRADVPPVALAFWRWCLASIIACILAKPYLKKDWPVIIKNWKITLFLSLTGITSFNTLVYMGLQWTVAINGLLLQSMIPVVIVVFAAIAFRERATVMQVVGIFLSLCGVITIISHGDFRVLQTLAFNKGDTLVFGAVISYGLYSVGLRRRPHTPF